MVEREIQAQEIQEEKKRKEKELRVRIPKDLWEKVFELSQKRTYEAGKYVSVSALVREALEKYLEDLKQ